MNPLTSCFRNYFHTFTQQHPGPEEQHPTQHTRDDGRTPLLAPTPTEPMVYPQGNAWFGRLLSKLAPSAAGGVGKAGTSARSDAPALPIDIDALLAKVVSYRNTLDNLRKENTNPGEFLSKTGERFIPCIIAMENARAEEKARKLKNPVLAVELSYYDDTRDMFLHAHALHAGHAPGSPARTLHGVVQEDATEVSHTYYCNVLIDEKSATNVGIESACKDVGEELLTHLNKQAAGFPGVENTVIATDIHKSDAGCPTFATTTAIKVAREPGRVPGLHAKMKGGEQLETILDEKGDYLDWTVYLASQSEDQTKAVAKNPRFPNLKDAVLPKNKNKAEPRASGETFLQHHQNRRVTQEVEIKKTGKVMTRTFSNASDLKRIKSLDRLIAHLKNLQKKHGNQAGQVYADQLAKVRPAREPSWDACLPKTRALFGSAWDAAEGLKLFHVEKDQWDEQTPEMKKEIRQELMEGLSTWSTPSLQAHALSFIDGDLTENFGREWQLDSAESLALVNALPALVLPALQETALEMTGKMSLSPEGIAALLDKTPDMATPALQQHLLWIVENWQKSIGEHPDEGAAAIATACDVLARLIKESGDDDVVESLIRINGAGIIHFPQDEAIQRMKELAGFLGGLKTGSQQLTLVDTLTEGLLDKTENSPGSEPAYGAIFLDLTKQLAGVDSGHKKKIAEKLLWAANDLFYMKAKPDSECRQQIMQALEHGIASMPEMEQGTLPKMLANLKKVDATLTE